jgi:tetratricopeptide (TPR) repeat protein
VCRPTGPSSIGKYARVSETTTRARGSMAASFDLASTAAFAVPALLLVYLALRNGGYDPIPTGEVGLTIWWIVLIGTIAGALPVTRPRSPSGVVLILLAALAGWALLSLAWTESDERTMIEVARTVTYAGVLLLGASLVARGHGRPVLAGVTAALGLIIVFAALSRLEPSWFPEQNVGEFLPDIELESRLAYPINYSSGLAALCGLAIPLFTAAAASGRSLIARLLGAALLPVTALTLWLTGSSLAVPVVVIAIAVYLMLTRERVAGIVSLAIGAVGGGVLIVAANAREALDRGLDTPAALAEGDSLLVILLVVTAATMGAQALASAVFSRHPKLRGPLISRRAVWVIVAAGAAVVLVAGIAAGAPGNIIDRLEDFSSAEGLDPDEGARSDQVLDVSARGRFQYWEGSLDAYATEPLLGIGPGTFEFYWAREGDPEAAIFVRDAHSLYLETLAELGPVGFLLVLGIAGTVLIAGIRQALRAPPESRAICAAAVASCAVFLAVAVVDWIWELAALGMAFFFVAAVAIGREAPRSQPAEGARLRPAAPVIALAVLALIAIAIPFAGATLVEQSRDSYADGRPEDALDGARNAVAIQPNAATPRIQEATVLEAIGDLEAAVETAREATEREPTNWRLWMVLSRLEARYGDAEAAVEAYERGQSLFPRVVLLRE